MKILNLKLKKPKWNQIIQQVNNKKENLIWSRILSKTPRKKKLWNFTGEFIKKFCIEINLRD